MHINNIFLSIFSVCFHSFFLLSLQAECYIAYCYIAYYSCETGCKTVACGEEKLLHVSFK